MQERDLIDHIQAQWARERPDLNSSAFALVGRLILLGRLLERRVNRALAPLGLQLWAFDVLATLRRQGPPYQLAPTELSRATLLTPGAMTNRIDRLEADGLVRRESDPIDRRAVRVILTDHGLAVVDEAIEVRFEEARSAIDSLNKQESSRLESLLRQLVTELGHEAESAGSR